MGTALMLVVLVAGSGDAMREEVEAVQQRRIFFGHQSVGGNVLEGLSRLGVHAKPWSAEVPAGPGLFEAANGTNGDPLSKVRQFTERLEHSSSAPAEIALFKLCYVDFGHGTDVEALFRAYQAAHEARQQRFPRTVFVHVTVPLTTVQRGVKGWLKQVLGKPVAGAEENLRRHQFNELLRKRYAGKEPLFDLAALESDSADGRVERFEKDGKQVPALLPELTDDGGHLNVRGQDRAARELVRLLAAVPLAPR